MSELEAIVLASPAAEALASIDPNLPADLIPGSPHSLYDVAHGELNGQRISALTASPLQAAPYLRPLESIDAPDQLPSGLLLISTANRQFSLTTPSPFGFDLHWLREIASGVLRGTTGIRIDANPQATLSASLAGQFVAAATCDTIDGAPALRLVLSSSSTASFDARATVTAGADIPVPERPDELVSSLLGTHPLQWARDAMNGIGSIRFTRIAQNCGARSTHLERVLEAWRTLGVRAESALWSALSSSAAWQSFRQWTALLANSSTTDVDLLARLRAALSADPTFASSPAARWLEAISNRPLSALPSAGALDRLRAASSLIEKLAADDRVEALLRRLPVRALSELNLDTLWPWAQNRFAEFFGSDIPASGRAAALAPLLQLQDRVYTAARQALASKLRAELSVLLSRTSRDVSLADVSVPFSPEGLALFRRILSGDLTPLFEASPLLRLRHGLLSHYVRRVRHVEVHVPFLDRNAWESRAESFAQAEATASTDGRILVRFSAQSSDTRIHSGNQSTLVYAAALSTRDGNTVNDNFTLAFTDERTITSAAENRPWLSVLDAYGLPAPALPPEPCRAVLSLSLPGSLAESWTTAPHSRDEQYFPTMCRISRALQAMSRRWLPALYLSSLDSYSSPSAAHPLLAWQYSQPYTGVKKGHLGYDFMDPQALERAINSAARSFPDALAAARQALLAAGRTTTASYYEPADARYILAAVLRQRRNFTALLAADNFFIEEVVRLADCARELRALAAAKPAVAVRNMCRYSDAMVRAFHRNLNRLYARQDFLALGPLFLLEATAALHATTPEPARVAATLVLHIGGGTVTYANETARRIL